jgi:hypothetical protein
VKRFVCILLIAGVLGASLEGATDIGNSADPCSSGSCFSHDTASQQPDAGDDRESDRDCAVCTPFCHCGVHAAALTFDSFAYRSPTPDSLVSLIALPYASFLQPPFLPPPIL